MVRGWALLLLLYSCSSKTLTTIDVSDRGAHILFLAILEEQDDGLLIRDVLGPLAIEDGRTSFGGGIETELREGQDPIFVEFPLQALGGGFQLEREEEIALETAPPPLRPTDVPAPSDLRVVTRLSALPSSARFFRPTEAGTETEVSAGDPGVDLLMAGATLSVPYNPEFCRPEDERPISTFGSSRQAVVAAETGDFGRTRIDRVIRLDDRAILRTPTRLHLVRANDPPLDADLVSDPRVLSNRELFGQSHQFKGIAIDPRTRADGRVRIIVVAREETQEDLYSAHVAELLVDDAGFELVGTASAADISPTDVAIDADGSFVVLGEDATLLMAPPDQLRFTRSSIGEAISDAHAIAFTDDPNVPLVAASENQLHQLKDGAWASDVVGLRVDNTDFRSIVSAGRGAALEVWSVASTGVVAHLVDGSFEEVDLRLPPRFVPCSQLSDGSASLADQDLRDVAIRDGYLFILVEKCSALVQVRLSDRCTSLLTVDGEEPQPLNRLLSLHHDGELTIAGEDGWLYSTY